MEIAKTDLIKKSLKSSRIFGDLGDALLSDIASLVSLSMVKGGDFVFRQGAVSDSMIVLVSGRLVATYTDSEGHKKTLADISPGSSAGELGVILQQPRSASVIAIRDSFIALLSKASFDTLLNDHPIEINRAVTRTVFEYNTLLNKKSRIVSASIITFVAAESVSAKNQGNSEKGYKNKTEQLCQDLCRSIGTNSKVKLIGPAEGNTLLRDSSNANQISIMINELERSYDYIIFHIDNDDSDWSRLAARQSDQIVVVADASQEPKDVHVHSTVIEGNMFWRIRKSLVLMHDKQCQQPVVHLDWQNCHKTLKFDNIYPIRKEFESDINRLKRFLTDSAVALVLGGGGARGLAHVGVIKALEEQNIPIDYVCGNSMGALIGAQYIFGTPVDELIKSTQQFIKGGERITVPFFSLLAGTRIKRDLKRMFKDANVEALWRPFFSVSCNISRATIHVHDKGPLWEAVLASNSPAGILPPVIKDGNLLVDGALLDNVPVESMRQKLRYGTLIAIDVDVSNELNVANDMTRFSKLQHIKQAFKRDTSKIQPGILELLNRSGHLGGLARRKIAKEMADFYLQPPVKNFGLMAYGRGNEIAETAYQYTVNHIQSWSNIEELKEKSQ